MSSSRVVLVTIFIALLTTVIPILAVDYTVGVKAGDWIKYGEINVSWNGTETEPSDITDMKKIDWMKEEVKNVSGTEVTIETTVRYKNGTTAPSSNSTIDVATGGFIPFLYMPFLLIAADLKEGDSIWQQSGAGKINGTVTRTYCGASRSVNFEDMTIFIPSLKGQTVSYTVKVYWDKATGVMMELYMSLSATTSTTQGSMEILYKATETNMWSADILGLISNNIIYIAGIAGLVVIIIVSVFIVRKRKPTLTVTPTPTAVEEKLATPA